MFQRSNVEYILRNFSTRKVLKQNVKRRVSRRNKKSESRDLNDSYALTSIKNDLDKNKFINTRFKTKALRGKVVKRISRRRWERSSQHNEPKSSNQNSSEDASITIFRLHKMEQQLTYSLSRYYAALNLSISQDKKHRITKLEKNEITFLEDDNNVCLPFYSSLSTEHLPKFLLLDKDKLVQSSTTLENLYESEDLYKGVQTKLLNIVDGWTKLTHSSNPKSHNDFETSISESEEEYLLLKTAYPVRAEAWLEKSEELLYQRHQIVLKFQENHLLFLASELINRAMRALFLPSIIDKGKALTAHLTIGGGLKSWLKVFRSHVITYKLREEKDSSNEKKIELLHSRLENIIDKMNVAFQRGNLRSKPNDIIYTELIRQYMDSGSLKQVKKADILCQHMFEGRELTSCGKPTDEAIKHGEILLLVMKAYNNIELKSREIVTRIEEVMNILLSLEKKAGIPAGKIAGPEAFKVCFSAFIDAESKKVLDVTQRTKMMFKKFHSAIWDGDEMLSLEEQMHLLPVYNYVLEIYCSKGNAECLTMARSLLMYMEKTFMEKKSKYVIAPNTKSFEIVLVGICNHIEQMQRSSKNLNYESSFDLESCDERDMYDENKTIQNLARVGLSCFARMVTYPDAQVNDKICTAVLFLCGMLGEEAGKESEALIKKMELETTFKKQNLDKDHYFSLIKNLATSAKYGIHSGAALKASNILHKLEVLSGVANIFKPDLPNHQVAWFPRESPFWTKNLAPDESCYSNVLRICAYSKGANIDQGLELAFLNIDRMIKRGFRPDVEGLLKCVGKLIPSKANEEQMLYAGKIVEFHNRSHTTLDRPAIEAIEIFLKEIHPELLSNLFKTKE